MKHKDPGHRWHTAERQGLVGIDRERSLRAVQLAEKSFSKNKHVRSHSKYHQYDFRGLKDKKMELIHQIQQKLSMPQDIEHNSQNIEGNNGTLKNRVLRLEKMMSQIRKQRVLTEQPKTVFVRQQLPQSSQNNQSHVEKTYIHKQRSSNMQMMVRQINSVRHEISEIHRSNEKVLKQSHINQPRKFSSKVNSHGYEQFKRQREAEMFSRFPPAQMNQQEVSNDSPPTYPKPELMKKQSLINELKRMIPARELQKTFFGTNYNRSSQDRQLEPGVNTQLYNQSEVVYTWKLGQRSSGQYVDNQRNIPLVRVSGPEGISTK